MGLRRHQLPRFLEIEANLGAHHLLGEAGEEVSLQLLIVGCLVPPLVPPPVSPPNIRSTGCISDTIFALITDTPMDIQRRAFR